MRIKVILSAIVFLAITNTPSPAFAQENAGPGVSTLDVIQVTATRFREPVQELPNAITVISGEELLGRGVHDLRTALSLIGGVSVAEGGDAGSASSVPSILSRREADDFLLIVDGVPSGGAFLPQFDTLDLNNVERIEVQRGSAPVFFGTTAFAGTINVIHYPAGSAENIVHVSYGSFGSFAIHGSTPLSDGPIKQSVAADISRDQLQDRRAGADRVHGLYRLSTGLVGGEVRLDLNASLQHQKPESPAPIGSDGFDPRVPLDFNQNPDDRKIETQRFAITLGYDLDTVMGSWGSSLSVNQSHTSKVQGFLTDLDQQMDPTSFNATGFDQSRNITEGFLDTHLTTGFFNNTVTATFGLNELYGLARQTSEGFSYAFARDGSSAQSSADVAHDPAIVLSDMRSFAGIYAQGRWLITPAIGLLGGLRVSHLDERRSITNADGNAQNGLNTTRLTGSLGAHWRIWSDPEADLDDVVLYGNYANTFQQAQLDFGPAPESGGILKPETAQTFEMGVKLDGLEGRFDMDISAFIVNFANQPRVVSVGGAPQLQAGGRQQYEGFEVEGHYQIIDTMKLIGSYSYNDARYRNFETVDGAGNAIQLSGNHLPLSPENLAALGIVYGGESGLHASATGNLTGTRYLNGSNDIGAKSYVLFDLNVGYLFRQFGVSVSGYNLSNRRDPIQTSELGEGQAYRQHGRRLFVNLSMPLS